MIEFIITSSVLISVVIVLRFLFRRKISRRLQYSLWGLVLLRLLMPFPLLGSSFSIMNIIPYSLPISTQHISIVPGGIGTTDGSSDNPVIILNAANTHYTETMSVHKALGLIWLAGSILVGFWIIGSNFIFYNRLYKTRRAYAADFRLPVYVSGYIASPCLFGILHPGVYLTPKAIENESNTSYVLMHELCHFRHGDHIWSIMRGLCIAAYWWNLLVWAAAILSRIDSELACDEAVIRQIGEENRLTYGYTLVDMITVKKAPSGILYAATTMISGKRGIKERLNMIIKKPKTFISAMVAVLLTAAVCVGGTFTGAKAASITAEEVLKQPLTACLPGENGKTIEKTVDLLNTPAFSVSYSLARIKNGKVQSSLSPLSGDEAKLAEDIIFNYMIKSAAWPAKVDVKTIDECYLLRAAYTDNSATDYYVYLQDGKPVMQIGTDGFYSLIDDKLYKKLTDLAHSITAAAGKKSK